MINTQTLCAYPLRRVPASRYTPNTQIRSMEFTMTRFSKVDMFNELRTIFLFEADHVLMGAGSEAAAAFIGFDVPEDGEFCHLPPEKVDLKRFQINGSFDR